MDCFVAKRLRLASIGVVLAMTASLLASPAPAKTLRFAFPGELKSVDPYQIAEGLNFSLNGSVYEGLVRRGPDLQIQPCLAESWEVLDPLHWRFHLRKGVKFHDGEEFTADDVIFSAHRVLSAGSDGIDGNTQAAGAIADPTTVSRAHAFGFHLKASLAAFNACPMFTALGDSVVTGPTGQNLRDLRLLISENE